MDDAHESTRPPTIALRFAFGCLGVLSFIFGYLGFSEWLAHSPAYGHRPVDLIYYTFQLFALGADPLQQRGPYPILLEIARFAAPPVTIYALIEAGRVFFAAEVHRLRVTRARDHVIVCGDSPVAEALSWRLRSAGHRVVEVRSTVGSMLPPDGLWQIPGDARNPAVLRLAGADRAAALYACTNDGVRNTAIALTAGRIRPSSAPPLRAYASIPDDKLCLVLQARYLELPHPDGLRLDFFNIDELAARKLFTSEPLGRINGRPPRILVAGLTAFGRCVTVEAARRWQAIDLHGSAQLPVTLVGPAGDHTRDSLIQRYPFLQRVCRFTVHNVDLPDLLSADGMLDPPDRAYLCYDNDSYALKVAVTADRLWRGQASRLLVRLDQLSAFRDTLDIDAIARLFGDTSESLRIYGVTHGGCDPELINEDLLQRLAREIHQSYQVAQQGPDRVRVSPTADVAWEDLPSTIRLANRLQAEDIGRKLRTLGCVLVARTGNDDDQQLADAEIDRLAVMEHERWCAEQTNAGWRYGEHRDDSRKVNPALQEWVTLPPEIRQRNHQAMRALTTVLADAGFRVVRVPQPASSTENR